jgi:hypothetical protein
MVILLNWLIFSFVIGYIGNTRKIGFWYAFSLSLVLSPLIGLIITINSKNEENEPIKKKKIISPQNNSTIHKNIDKELLLNDLKKRGIISTEEYNLKISEIEFNEKLNELINPLLDTLIESRNKGVLNEDEFMEKKMILIEKETLNLKKWYENKPKMTNIDPDIINSLKDHHKFQLEEKLNFLGKDPINAKNYVIVFEANKVKLMETKRWDSIKANNLSDKFKLIYQNSIQS